jgi:DNA-binding beta-propeller fold protein YncE
MAKTLVAALLSVITLPVALIADANYPTGTRGLLLIDKLGSTIRFFDPTTFKERSSIAVATKPHDFVLTADRKTAYVPLYGDGIFGRNPNPGHEVAIVDMDAARSSVRSTLRRIARRMGFRSDRTARSTRPAISITKLLVIDPKARKVTKAIDTDGTTHWIGILPNGSKIYATNKNDPFVTVNLRDRHRRFEDFGAGRHRRHRGVT